MRKLVMITLVGMLVTFFAGCGKEQSISLERTQWKLVAWTISSIKADAHEITADFTDKIMSGKSAVNSYSGDYSIEGKNITFGPFAATKMAGPQEAMQAEADYFKLLEQVSSLKVEGSKLYFMDKNGYDLLVFQMTSIPEI
jgi:heat shock protein HslJ